MGKRCIVGYSNYFMIGLKGPGALNSAWKGEMSPTLNNVHCLNLEYVSKERRMVCISGQYLRTGIAYDDGKMGEFAGIFLSGNDFSYNFKYKGDHSKPALLRSFNISFGLKIFGKGFVAPVGRYRKMEILLLCEKVKYDYKNFAERDQSISSSSEVFNQVDYGTGEYSYKNFAIAYTFGCQRVLNDKFVLDYGIRFGLTPQFNVISLLASDEYVNSPESYYRHEANIRILRGQLANFHLGIGFLAF